MATSLLISPEAIRQKLQKRYRNQVKNWLAGEGEWPLSLTLGAPTEAQAKKDTVAVRQWQQQWQDWKGEGEVQWCPRHWRILGKQTIPEYIVFRDVASIARLLHCDSQWQLASERYGFWIQRYPTLGSILCKYFDLLAQMEEEEHQCLVNVMQWLIQNPHSELYPRQLPISGVHSKWIEQHQSLISKWLLAIQEIEDTHDFYSLTGLRRNPETIRIRLLDHKLRRAIGNISDMKLTLGDLKGFDLPVKKVYVVENLQTFLAFEDIPGSIVIFGSGYAAEQLKALSWLEPLPIIYWGDIDTHGFNILNQLRITFPQVESMLMDETCLMRHRSLWTQEKQQICANLESLREEENQLYLDICNNRWGSNLRLEQERVLWDYAWSLLRDN